MKKITETTVTLKDYEIVDIIRKHLEAVHGLDSDNTLIEFRFAESNVNLEFEILAVAVTTQDEIVTDDD